MPRTPNGSYLGNFSVYQSNSEGEFADDEEAIAMAADEMFTMCGNPGQESLIGDYLVDFEDWAYTILETEDHEKDSMEAFAAEVIDWYGGEMDKWWGTYEIWLSGYDLIATMYGFHDKSDEMGEGTGR